MLRDSNVYCNKCDCTFKTIRNLKRHYTTIKHQTNRYTCSTCEYITNSPYNWLHHTHDKFTTITLHNTSPRYECLHCDKTYKYQSGLSRHYKDCIKRDLVVLPTNEHMIESLHDVMKTIVTQQQQLTELINIQNDIIPNIGTTKNNMTINVFLNEYCKDAMNLTEFVNSIHISLEDLEYTNQHGYVKGVSNIFTKHLTAAGEKQRPIHCSDKKRLQFYVKDGDMWDRDMQNCKLDQSITDVTNKAFNEIVKWQAAHPGFNNIYSPLNKEWLIMVQTLNECGSENDIKRNKDNIKKNMTDSLILKEAIKTR
jgi:hypothetical protein